MPESTPAIAVAPSRPVRDLTLPPHHLDTEATILAALMGGEVTTSDLLPLAAQHFYAPANRYIFEAIAAIAAAGQPVDAVGVAGRLREAGRLNDVGGVPELARILDTSPALAAPVEAVRLVVDAWARREAGAEAQRLVLACRRFGPDTAEMLRGAAERFRQIEEARGASEGPTDLLAGFTSDMARVQDAANAAQATVTTGMSRVDEAMCGGWWQQKMVIVGARPGTGKTAVGIRSTLACVETKPEDGGGGALFISAELPADEMRQRILSHEAGLTAAMVRRPTAEQSGEMVRWITYLAGLPVWIDDRARTITAVRASVRRHVRLAAARSLPLRLVVIDYVQRIRAEGRWPSKNEEMSEVCRQLAEMRNEHPGVSLLVLAQLNRESSDGRKPRDSDLRECGQLEQDADTIALLWRPEKDDPDVVEMTFAKNRGLKMDVAPRFRTESQHGRLVEEVTP